jgi:GNAT superfamily N-acetyltransferase
MYAEWTRNSCSGQMADHIAVATSNGKVVGYVAVRYPGNYNGLCNAQIALWGLGAVSPDSRSRGIFSDLIIHNLEWLSRRGADYCFGGTQGNNISQQRALLKAGLKPAMTALSLHYWAND